MWYVFRLTLFAAAVASATMIDQNWHTARSLNVLHLHSRQTVLDPNNFPEQCKARCTPTINAFNTCLQRATSEQADCFCTQNNADNYEDCVNCMAETGPPSMRAEAQGLMDNFNRLCAGYGIPSLTLDTPVAGSTPAGQPPTPPSPSLPSPSPPSPSLPSPSPPSPSPPSPSPPSPSPPSPSSPEPIFGQGNGMKFMTINGKLMTGALGATLFAFTFLL